MAISSRLPIKLVTFDLYDTLIEMVPPRWERLANAGRKIGVYLDLEALREADVVAEDFYTTENAGIPIRDRSAGERDAFRLEFMERWLRAAGEDPTPEMVRQLRVGYVAEFDEHADQSHYVVSSDVMPALAMLREHGVKRAVISNADRDVTEMCMHFAFAHEMNVIVTSAIVGYEKPDVRTYQAAFEPLDIAPEFALHIGDQPSSDVVGALAAGMQAALIDRYRRHDPMLRRPVPVFHDLLQLARQVVVHNERVGGVS